MSVLHFAPNEAEPSVQKREVIQLLICLRRASRTTCRQIDDLAEANRAEGRVAKKRRASGDPLLIRNAEVIEARIAKRRGAISTWNETLRGLGGHIRAIADDVDRLIPTKELLDILEVNPVDRARVGPNASIREIVFVHALEDSATHRGSEWKEGPLFEALSRYMMHTIETNQELQRQVTDGLFGKGGMLEFVPTYSRTAGGDFVRNPPKLRLADGADPV